jgi:hypothetical protein
VVLGREKEHEEGGEGRGRDEQGGGEPEWGMGRIGGIRRETHAVPPTLNTFNCVSSKLIYPNVSPANSPDNSTKTGIRITNSTK